jgi:prephenate dehydrogenase
MRIAIIGLGLIGGSIGLALKHANWKKAEIVGFVRRQEAGSLALKLGAVDRVESDLRRAIKGTSIVIVATPVLTIRDIFVRMAPALSADCIVTDTASTKLQVMKWAEELLPETVDFVGGHPMAGKESSGIQSAKAELFHNCTYCLTPPPRGNPASLRTVKDMVKALGAAPVVMDAQEHDELVAGISHLPLLLSVALVLATTESISWEKMSHLAASGYRDLTRLASGNPEVNAHICLSNQAAIVSWIDVFTDELSKLRRLIGGGNTDIERALSIANEARRKWLEKRD